MRPDERHRSQFPFDPAQRTLDFNPLEVTPEEGERLRRLAAKWMREEAEEEFHQLPGETMAEFYEARERHLQELETFGPLFPPEPSEAWKMVQGLRRAIPPPQPRQLILPFNDSLTKPQK